MKNLSIEYAHIYTNDKIGEEHELAYRKGTKLELILRKKNNL